MRSFQDPDWISMQSKKETMQQKSSRRSKAEEAMEAMEARMLKPSISGNHLDFEEAAQRASASSSNKKLDLNAPLLSVRRLRAADAPSNARIQQAQDHQPQCSSSSPSNSRRVPFFAWEQQQQRRRRRGGSGGSGAAFLPVLTPPPGRLSPAHHHACTQQQGLEDGFHPATAGDGLLQLGGDLDARSDTVFAHTEAGPSVAATCLVSFLDGDSDTDDDDCVVGQQQQQQQQQEEIDAAAREFILRRFLPAAKAVANELSPAAAIYDRQPGSFAASDVWKPLANPSPQRLPHSRSQHEIQAQRQQRFQDLLFVGDNGEEEEKGEDEEEDDGYESSSVVGGNICGFIPLFKLGGTMKIFRSNNGNQNNHQQQQQQQAQSPPVMSKTWKKFEPEQRKQGHAGEDDIQCWSDEDGNDDPSSRRESSGNYLACRYTPSRGNLGSPITIASKGFLGTPTDRVWRKTSIKRMYPIGPYETTTTTKSSSSNYNKVNCHANADADSDSSESLISLRLDKMSATTSRQSSVNEKIFCLDTLNQVREEAAKLRTEVVETYSVVDERGHPNVVVPSDNQTLRNSADKQQQQLGELMEEAAKVLYTSKRSVKRAPPAAQEVRVTEVVEMDTSKKSFEKDGNYALPAEMRICWHEEGGGDDKPHHQALNLPAPVGPSQSWLTSARLSSASKPPLGKPKAKLLQPKLDQFSTQSRRELVYTKEKVS